VKNTIFKKTSRTCHNIPNPGKQHRAASLPHYDPAIWGLFIGRLPGTTHRQLVNQHSGLPDADWDALAFLTTGADTRIQLQVISKHGDPL